MTTDSPYAYAADFDGSGTVDLSDLGIFSAGYQLGRSNGSIACPSEEDQTVSAVPQTALTSAAVPAIPANSAGRDSERAMAIAGGDKSGLAAEWQKQPGVVFDNVERAILARHWMMAVEKAGEDEGDARDMVFAEIGAGGDAFGLLD
ncbi:MAG: hypothetical protein U9N87_08645 [Planctomycetota bacterium]|nr:hypothetical protein [Planctomycetota bacterium]